MRLIFYAAILLLWLPLIRMALKKGAFVKAPLFTVYLYSVFFLNILGSCVVFFPELNIYDDRDFFSYEFFYILTAQTLALYIFFPINIMFSTKGWPASNSIIFYIQARKSFILLSALALVILIVFYVQHGMPPLYTGDFSGGNSTLMNARVEFFESTERVWFYRIGFYILPQVAGIISYLLYKNNKNIYSRFAFFISSLLISILALSFLHKTPVAIFWFSIFLAKIFDEQSAKTMTVLKWMLGIFMVIVLWYLVYFPGQDALYYLDFMMRSILNRIFGSYPMGLAMAVDVVEEQGLYWGTTMNNPMGILPYEVVNLSEIVHWKLFAIEGSHPPPAIGYGYVDFGWLGVVGTLLFINIYLVLLQVLVNRIKNKVLYIALISYLSMRIMFLAMSSAAEILLNVGEVITLFMILCVFFVATLKVSNVSLSKRC